jgi:DNA-directed RNA polymerase specialized sigma24 family protein
VNSCCSAWTALPAAQRAVFLLHHEDGLSLDELARALDLGFETAKSRLRYAMNKLRSCMGAYLPHGGLA